MTKSQLETVEGTTGKLTVAMAGDHDHGRDTDEDLLTKLEGVGRFTRIAGPED